MPSRRKLGTIENLDNSGSFGKKASHIHRQSHQPRHPQQQFFDQAYSHQHHPSMKTGHFQAIPLNGQGQLYFQHQNSSGSFGERNGQIMEAQGTTTTLLGTIQIPMYPNAGSFPIQVENPPNQLNNATLILNSRKNKLARSGSNNSGKFPKGHHKSSLSTVQPQSNLVFVNRSKNSTVMQKPRPMRVQEVESRMKVASKRKMKKSKISGGSMSNNQDSINASQQLKFLNPNKKYIFYSSKDSSDIFPQQIMEGQGNDLIEVQRRYIPPEFINRFKGKEQMQSFDQGEHLNNLTSNVQIETFARNSKNYDQSDTPVMGKEGRLEGYQNHPVYQEVKYLANHQYVPIKGNQPSRLTPLPASEMNLKRKIPMYCQEDGQLTQEVQQLKRDMNSGSTFPISQTQGGNSSQIQTRTNNIDEERKIQKFVSYNTNSEKMSKLEHTQPKDVKSNIPYQTTQQFHQNEPLVEPTQSKTDELVIQNMAPDRISNNPESESYPPPADTLPAQDPSEQKKESTIFEDGPSRAAPSAPSNISKPFSSSPYRNQESFEEKPAEPLKISNKQSQASRSSEELKNQVPDPFKQQNQSLREIEELRKSKEQQPFVKLETQGIDDAKQTELEKQTSKQVSTTKKIESVSKSRTRKDHQLSSTEEIEVALKQQKTKKESNLVYNKALAKTIQPKREYNMKSDSFGKKSSALPNIGGTQTSGTKGDFPHQSTIKPSQTVMIKDKDTEPVAPEMRSNYFHSKTIAAETGQNKKYGSFGMSNIQQSREDAKQSEHLSSQNFPQLGKNSSIGQVSDYSLSQLYAPAKIPKAAAAPVPNGKAQKSQSLVPTSKKPDEVFKQIKQRGVSNQQSASLAKSPYQPYNNQLLPSLKKHDTLGSATKINQTLPTNAPENGKFASADRRQHRGSYGADLIPSDDYQTLPIPSYLKKIKEPFQIRAMGNGEVLPSIRKINVNSVPNLSPEQEEGRYFMHKMPQPESNRQLFPNKCSVQRLNGSSFEIRSKQKVNKSLQTIDYQAETAQNSAANEARRDSFQSLPQIADSPAPQLNESKLPSHFGIGGSLHQANFMSSSLHEKSMQSRATMNKESGESVQNYYPVPSNIKIHGMAPQKNNSMAQITKDPEAVESYVEHLQSNQHSVQEGQLYLNQSSKDTRSHSYMGYYQSESKNMMVPAQTDSQQMLSVGFAGGMQSDSQNKVSDANFEIYETDEPHQPSFEQENESGPINVQIVNDYAQQEPLGRNYQDQTSSGEVNLQTQSIDYVNQYNNAQVQQYLINNSVAESVPRNVTSSGYEEYYDEEGEWEQEQDVSRDRQPNEADSNKEVAVPSEHMNRMSQETENLANSLVEADLLGQIQYKNQPQLKTFSDLARQESRKYKKQSDRDTVNFASQSNIIKIEQQKGSPQSLLGSIPIHHCESRTKLIQDSITFVRTILEQGYTFIEATWDQEMMHEEMEISKGSRVIENPDALWRSAQAAYPMQLGDCSKFYFRFQVSFKEKKPQCKYFGLSPLLKPSQLQKGNLVNKEGIYFGSGSIGAYSALSDNLLRKEPSKLLIAPADTTNEDCTGVGLFFNIFGSEILVNDNQQLSPGDIIGVRLDMQQGAVYFDLNNQDMGLAYQGKELNEGVYFPTIDVGIAQDKVKILKPPKNLCEEVEWKEAEQTVGTKTLKNLRRVEVLNKGVNYLVQESRIDQSQQAVFRLMTNYMIARGTKIDKLMNLFDNQGGAKQVDIANERGTASVFYEVLNSPLIDPSSLSEQNLIQKEAKDLKQEALEELVILLGEVLKLQDPTKQAVMCNLLFQRLMQYPLSMETLQEFNGEIEQELASQKSEFYDKFEYMAQVKLFQIQGELQEVDLPTFNQISILLGQPAKSEHQTEEDCLRITQQIMKSVGQAISQIRSDYQAGRRKGKHSRSINNFEQFLLSVKQL